MRGASTASRSYQSFAAKVVNSGTLLDWVWVIRSRNGSRAPELLRCFRSSAANEAKSASMLWIWGELAKLLQGTLLA